MKDFFKEYFSDLITSKHITKPEGIIVYDVINFQSFIDRKFPDSNLNISIEGFDIRNKLIDKFKNDRTCFKEHGSLKEFSVNNLLYYQTDTGIEGPKFNTINEPVSILNYKGLSILYEGYHRTLIKIATDNLIVIGYELELEI